MTATINQDRRINFGVYHINDQYQWGFEIIDTIENVCLKRDFGFSCMKDARQAGFYEAKHIIQKIEISKEF